MLQGSDGPVAAVWVQHLGDRIGDLHLCVSPDLRGRWVSPRSLRLLAHALRSDGYLTVEARPSCPEHAGYLVRLGFSRQPDGFRLPLYEDTHP